jgi:hypothetical protein
MQTACTFDEQLLGERTAEQAMLTLLSCVPVTYDLRENAVFWDVTTEVSPPSSG